MSPKGQILWATFLLVGGVNGCVIMAEDSSWMWCGLLGMFLLFPIPALIFNAVVTEIRGPQVYSRRRR